MNPMTRKAILLAATSLILSGCTTLWQDTAGTNRSGVSSSLVNYLYPSGEEPPPYDDRVPHLSLPLRVGIAFVPVSRYSDIPGVAEASKIELLDKVRKEFIDLDYVSDIQVIPDTYMQGSRGFTGLEQVARLYQLDLIALVSYDQVVASDDTRASFLYWTIVGAYFIEGSKNDVQTFVDTAVFDIAARRLLIRAPGIDKASRTSTLIESNEELREERSLSFDRAIEDMTANLKGELERFEARVEENPALVQIDRSRMGGIGGGGSSSLLTILTLLLLTIAKSATPSSALSRTGRCSN